MSRARSDAEQVLRRIVNEACDAGLDSCGWPMSKLRTALLDKARAVIADLDGQDVAPEIVTATVTLIYTGRGAVRPGAWVSKFVRLCRDLDEARRHLPELTLEQFACIRAATAYVTGNTETGLRYVTRRLVTRER